ncbi:MAG: hypothetical protein QE493_08055 [Verrucomicrobiae bacterium]|jgi:aminomethyltransferase|nr:hypothetical protein [Verrucomicrobiae bacterium]
MLSNRKDPLIPALGTMSALENKALLKKARSEGGAFATAPSSYLRVSGADRLRYLNGQITADLRKLSLGHSLSACLLTPKGRLVALLSITIEGEAFLIETDPLMEKVVLERLERYLVADDVVIEVITPPDTIHFFGPLAHHPEIEDAPGTLISRIGFPGKDLTQIFHTDSNASCKSLIDTTGSNFCSSGMKHIAVVEDPPLPNLHQPLQSPQHDEYEISDLETARFSSLPSIGPTILLSPNLVEILRIEQKIPRWGFELTSETLPPEARLEEKCIDYEKGCYLGQEVISRLKSLGHVNRLLYGFTSKEKILPGMDIYIKEDPSQSVGIITSAALQIDSGSFIALGYLRRGSENRSHYIAQDPKSVHQSNIIINNTLSSQ